MKRCTFRPMTGHLQRWAVLPLGMLLSTAQATILTFDLNPVLPNTPAMPQDYGDRVGTDSMLSESGTWQNEYQQGNAWTPDITVGYSTQRSGEFPRYRNSPEWPGVCFLWSDSFRAGAQIGVSSPSQDKMMPVGFEYYFTFTPVAANKAVVVNSFVLDDRLGYFDSVSHVVQWRVVQGNPAGPVLASGSETFAGGAKVLVSTSLTAETAGLGPVMLVIKRIAGTEDDLAVDDINFDEAGLPTKSYNTGSLGALADGLNTGGVVLDQPGAVRAGGDASTAYANSERTTLPFLPEMNPPAANPFTIEFWARPSATDNDDAPVFNRISDGDRSGWVFFQRNAATGWNFRMYDGVGSNVGWDLTGGTAVLNTWSHVAAVWSGSTARLYVNGILATATNAAGKSGVYQASSGAVFSVGSYDTGGSPVNGPVDEIAFYPSALAPARILAHYNAATTPVAGTYRSAVLADNPLLYFQQNPPSAAMSGSSLTPTVIFTGILSESENLSSWKDLDVASPYTPAAPRPGRLFFRSHR